MAPVSSLISFLPSFFLVPFSRHPRVTTPVVVVVVVVELFLKVKKKKSRTRSSRGGLPFFGTWFRFCS